MTALCTSPGAVSMVCLCFSPGACLPLALWVPWPSHYHPFCPGWSAPASPDCWSYTTTRWQLLSGFYLPHPYIIPSRVTPPLLPRDEPCSRISLLFSTQSSHKMGHNSTQQCLPQSLAHLVSIFSPCTASSRRTSTCVRVCVCWGGGM